jgi:hypothetical protein
LSFYRRVGIEFTAGTTGFNAGVNQVLAGTSRVATGFQRATRQGGLFQNQLKAIGTTARYFIAGSLVFGITSAIQRLGEFQSQLGRINTLAGNINKQGQFSGLGDQLDNVGRDALLMSNRFGIAVGDVETYMQRFFSSFNMPNSPVKARIDEMNQYTRALLNLTTFLGPEAGDPQKLAGGLTGLINALPGGRRNPGSAANEVANMFAQLIQTTPQLLGADIANAAGRLAQSRALSAMSVPETLGVFGLASQVGGSPSVTIRGVTQLLGASLLHPKTPQNLAIYQRAGLPTDPNALRELGGLKVLETLLNFAQQIGTQHGKLNVTAIYDMFGRQESVRQFVALLGQGGVKALREYIKQVEHAAKSNKAETLANEQLRHNVLLRMSTARQNLGMTLVQTANWPLQHLIADPLIATSNAVIRHPRATQVAVGGALALATASRFRRLLGAGRFGGRLGRFLGIAGAAQQEALNQAITKEELPAAIAGGKTDGSRGNPFWVIISPLSWSMAPQNPLMPGPGGGPGVGVGGKKLPPWIGIGGGALGVAATTVAMLALTDAGASGNFGAQARNEMHRVRGSSMLSEIEQRRLSGGHISDIEKQAIVLSTKSMAAAEAYLRVMRHQTTLDAVLGGLPLPQALTEALSRALDPKQRQPTKVEGHAKIDVTTTVKDTAGNTIGKTTKHGVPVKFWDKSVPHSNIFNEGKRGTHN